MNFVTDKIRTEKKLDVSTSQRKNGLKQNFLRSSCCYENKKQVEFSNIERKRPIVTMLEISELSISNMDSSLTGKPGYYIWKPLGPDEVILRKNIFHFLLMLLSVKRGSTVKFHQHEINECKRAERRSAEGPLKRTICHYGHLFADIWFTRSSSMCSDES